MFRIRGTVSFDFTIAEEEGPPPVAPGRPVIRTHKGELFMRLFEVVVNESPPKTPNVTSREVHVTVNGEALPVQTVQCIPTADDPDGWNYDPLLPSFEADEGDAVEGWLVDLAADGRRSPESERVRFTVEPAPPPPPPDDRLQAPDAPVIREVGRPVGDIDVRDSDPFSTPPVMPPDKRGQGEPRTNQPAKPAGPPANRGGGGRRRFN